MSDFKGTWATPSGGREVCAARLVPVGAGIAVELRSEHGGVFLRKLAESFSAAGSEAEYLRRQRRANPDTRQNSVLVVTVWPQDDPESDYPDAVLTERSLPPTLLAASRLLLSRVLPTSMSRPPTVPTA